MKHQAVGAPRGERPSLESTSLCAAAGERRALRENFPEKVREETRKPLLFRRLCGMIAMLE